MPKKTSPSDPVRPKGGAGPMLKSSYDPDDMPRQALELAARGWTDGEIARFYGKHRDTVYVWKGKYPEFAKALEEGLQPASERVVRTLYERAVGYTFKSVKIFMPAGAAEPVYAPFDEHVPPDVAACIFWLKNKKPLDWRDRRVVETDQNAMTDNSDKPLGDLSDTDLIRELEKRHAIRTEKADVADASRTPRGNGKAMH